MPEWFRTFFDRDYIDRYARVTDEEVTQREVDGVIRALGLEPPARVLDLACGYGRHALALSRLGYEVTGFDLSFDLLAEAELRAQGAGAKVRLMEGDMRKLPFVREFDVVVNLFTSFGFFDDERDSRRVMEGIHAALDEGGRLLLDVINRDAILRDFQPRMWRETDDGYVLSESAYDPACSRLTGRQVHVRRGGEVRESALSLRLYSLHELSALMVGAGFAVEAVYGDFDLSPFALDSPRIVAVGRRS